LAAILLSFSFLASSPSSYKPIIGFKNVKYGLISPQEIAAAATNVNKPGKPIQNNLFSIEEDEDARKEKERRIAAKKASKTEKMYQEILEKDPYAFSFDEVLPEIKRNERKAKVQKTEET